MGDGDQLGLVLEQRKNARLDRRQARRESQHDARFLLAALLVFHRLLGVSLAKHSQHGPVDARARLDDVRDVLGLGLLVEIFERLAAVLLVLLEIIVAPVGDALEFLDAKRKFVRCV